jgi:signal transduction histidine kinase
VQKAGIEHEPAALEAGLEMNQAILAGLPLRRLLVIISRRAYLLMRASLIVACTPAADGSGLAVRSAIGHGSERLRGWTIPIAHAELEALPDSSPIAFDAEPWSGFLPADVNALLKVGLVVPLRAHEQTMGLLLFGNRKAAGPLGDLDLRVVQLLASQAALAIAYHHSRQAMLRIKLAEDRERIARDLHDGIAQRLYGIGLDLLAMQPSAQTPALERHLDGAISDIDQAVRDVRAYMSELQPALLPDPQLELGLRRLAAEVAGRTDVAIEIDVDQHVAIRLADQTDSLLVIARERLWQLTRRADVTSCRVRLREREGMPALEIEDDGHGGHSEG